MTWLTSCGLGLSLFVLCQRRYWSATWAEPPAMSSEFAKVNWMLAEKSRNACLRSICTRRVSGTILSRLKKSLSELPSSIRGDWVRTASVERYKMSSRGHVPYGMPAETSEPSGFGINPGRTTRHAWPFRRVQHVVSGPGSRWGKFGTANTRE